MKISFFLMVICFSLGFEPRKQRRNNGSESKCSIRTESFQTKVGRFACFTLHQVMRRLTRLLQVFGVWRDVQGGDPCVQLPLLSPGHLQILLLLLQGQGEEAVGHAGNLSEQWNLLQQSNQHPQPSGL